MPNRLCNVLISITVGQMPAFKADKQAPPVASPALHSTSKQMRPERWTYALPRRRHLESVMLYRSCVTPRGHCCKTTHGMSRIGPLNALTHAHDICELLFYAALLRTLVVSWACVSELCESLTVGDWMRLQRHPPSSSWNMFTPATSNVTFDRKLCRSRPHSGLPRQSSWLASRCSLKRSKMGSASSVVCSATPPVDKGFSILEWTSRLAPQGALVTGDGLDTRSCEVLVATVEMPIQPIRLFTI